MLHMHVDRDPQVCYLPGLIFPHDLDSSIMITLTGGGEASAIRKIMVGHPSEAEHQRLRQQPSAGPRQGDGQEQVQQDHALRGELPQECCRQDVDFQ